MCWTHAPTIYKKKHAGSLRYLNRKEMKWSENSSHNKSSAITCDSRPIRRQNRKKIQFQIPKFEFIWIFLTFKWSSTVCTKVSGQDHLLPFIGTTSNSVNHNWLLSNWQTINCLHWNIFFFEYVWISDGILNDFLCFCKVHECFKAQNSIWYTHHSSKLPTATQNFQVNNNFVSQLMVFYLFLDFRRIFYTNVCRLVLNGIKKKLIWCENFWSISIQSMEPLNWYVSEKKKKKNYVNFIIKKLHSFIPVVR